MDLLPPCFGLRPKRLSLGRLFVRLPLLVLCIYFTYHVFVHTNPYSRENDSSVSHEYTPALFQRECGLASKVPMKLVYGVFTTIYGARERMVIRKTWMTFPSVCRHLQDERWLGVGGKPCQLLLRFVLGRPKTQKELEWIAKENGTFGDLVTLPCKENMNEGKSWEWWKFAAENFPEATHVGKGDMDTFVWAGELVRELGGLPRECVYYGRMNDYLRCMCYVLCPTQWTYMSGQLHILSTDLVQWVANPANQITATAKYGHEDRMTGQWLATAPFLIMNVDSKAHPFVHPLKNVSVYASMMMDPRAALQADPVHDSEPIKCHQPGQPSDIRIVLAHSIQSKMRISAAWKNDPSVCMHDTSRRSSDCPITIVPIACRDPTSNQNGAEILFMECKKGESPLFHWWKVFEKEFPWATHVGRTTANSSFNAQLLLEQIYNLPSTGVYYGRLNSDYGCRRCERDPGCPNGVRGHEGDSLPYMVGELYILSPNLASVVGEGITGNSFTASDEVADREVGRILKMASVNVMQVNVGGRDGIQPWKID